MTHRHNPMAERNTTHAPLDRMITLRVDHGTQANRNAKVQAAGRAYVPLG